MATPDGDGRRRGWGPGRPVSAENTAEGGAEVPPGPATPSATWPPRKPRNRRRWQRWLFGLLGVAWLVIGLVVGLGVGNWTVAALWLGLAAMELVLWIMAGRR